VSPNAVDQGIGLESSALAGDKAEQRSDTAAGSERARRATEALRESIRQLLVAEVAEVDGRVFEPHAMTIDDGLPALIVKIGAEDNGEDWTGRAATTTVEVWPYTTRERFTDLDVLAQRVKEVLDGARFSAGGREYYTWHLITGTDALDDLFGGITRTITFEAGDLTWLSGSTYEPDPITALREWAEDRWGTAVQTDPLSWDPRAGAPGIYFRWAGITRTVDRWPTWSLLECRIAGHILTPDPSERLTWTRRLHEALEATRRVHMGPDGLPLDIVAAGADSTTHPLRTGQITLLAQMGVLVPEEDTTQVQHVELTGAVPQQEVI
jgi:hypothetical protein